MMVMGVFALGGLAAWAKRLFPGALTTEDSAADLKAGSLKRQDVSMIKAQFPLGFQWQTQEPFLFCAYHHDLYPAGTAEFGPEAKLLAGREIGQDFQVKDGFRMYHGEKVPGFPVHPHRGFETITIVRKGYVDHADSLGAAGRYGQGDVQWMTAGGGVQHSEMFPLLKTKDNNTLELFQIWLNLPRKSKMVPAHFTMFWAEKIPVVNQGLTSVSVIAGQYAGAAALKPPPDSWASDPMNEVSVLLVKIKKGGSFTLPRTAIEAGRTMYFYEGALLKVAGQIIPEKTGVTFDSLQELKVESPNGDTEFLILQARSIGETTVQHGPFVMNTFDEIKQAFQDYQRTQFGGWSWPRQDMVHGTKIERFAKFPDGRVEKPEAKS